MTIYVGLHFEYSVATRCAIVHGDRGVRDVTLVRLAGVTRFVLNIGNSTCIAIIAPIPVRSFSI